MVRRGRAKVYCNECGIGCGAEVSIQHNNAHRLSLKSEGQASTQYEKVIDNECCHLNFSVSLYAHNSWTPWGDPDEIKFCLEAKCKKCSQSQICRDECQSFYQKDNYLITKECCGYKTNFEFCFTANTFLDHLASQSALWSGPIGSKKVKY
jgi:hypothetical protein